MKSDIDDAAIEAASGSGRQGQDARRWARWCEGQRRQKSQQRLLQDRPLGKRQREQTQRQPTQQERQQSQAQLQPCLMWEPRSRSGQLLKAVQLRLQQ